MSLAEEFNDELKSIETRFQGGLSNTSTRKFDKLIIIVSKISGIAQDEIYITAATSRASNLWNRLAQGKPLTQHFTLALGIIDASDLQGGISPASRFIGNGVGHYDAIVLAVKCNDQWTIGAVLDSDKMEVYGKFVEAFPGINITHEQANGVDENTNETMFAWYVGTTGNDDNGEWHDFSEEYINDGVWKNGWDDKFIGVVNSIQIGDRIAIKSTFTQKRNLPFNNHEKTVGAMRIKAIGIVTGNAGDGKQIQVDWSRLDPFKTWYGPGTLRETIHGVSADEGVLKKQLLEFTFGEAEQDYSLCEEKYNDEIDDVAGVDDATYGAKVEEASIDESKREKGGENVLLYGVPGSGKSWTIAKEYCSDEDKIERLVFHPDYMYSDFVGQILPVPKDGKVEYKFVPGPFTKILDKAYHDPANPYYLIIEEINRGNAPAIFGDIFQLLDRINEDKDGYKEGTSEYPVTNENIAKEVYGNKDTKVRIPSNLSIIGTMNTSDQNVFTLDNAFQRRWNMRLIRNSFTNHPYAKKGVLDTTVSWQGFCEVINAEILRRDSVASSEDKRLGAYFVALNDLVWNKEEDQIVDKESKEYIKAKHKNARFAEKVLKYLWDDAFKFNHPDVFVTSKDGRDVSSLEVLVECFSSVRGDKRFEIFEETIKEALLEATPKADLDDSEEQDVDVDGGITETTTEEQVNDVDGGDAASSQKGKSN